VSVARPKLPSWAIGIIGVLAIVAIWWVVALLVVSPGAKYTPVPTPPDVLVAAVTGAPGFTPAFVVTLTEAGIGFFWGNLIALVLSAFVLVVPRAEGILNQIAVITYCVPIIAVGQIVIIILGGSKAPGQPSATGIFLAALSVFFTTVVGSLLGLKAADRASLDVVTVFGGSKFTQLRKVRLIAALPNILSALQIAVPAAFLGAILGEYFGKTDRGVGPALIGSQISLQSDRVWALFVLCAAVSIVGYAIVGLLGRVIAPWSVAKRTTA
jgi:ABC-type nitrate/sulfonate/bicarbonate transport system permease component